MILVDTSVWIGYFRGQASAAKLGQLLEEDRVLLHPFVFGELMLGNLGRQRNSVSDDLRLLPAAAVVAHGEVLTLVQENRLWSRGLGWVDVHLLASALVSRAMSWSLDRKFSVVAAELGIAGGSTGPPP